MVNERVIIRDKLWLVRKFIKYGILFIISIIILFGVFLFGSSMQRDGVKIVFENPLKELISVNTNSEGITNYSLVIKQGILDFDSGYVEYAISALGIENLHKSLIPGYGNPVIELGLGNQYWSAEIVDGEIIVFEEAAEDEDIRIKISEEEIVEALASPDIEAFIKESIIEGNIIIEPIAGEVELYSKGYLDMYEALT